MIPGATPSPSTPPKTAFSISDIVVRNRDSREFAVTSVRYNFIGGSWEIKYDLKSFAVGTASFVMGILEQYAVTEFTLTVSSAAPTPAPSVGFKLGMKIRPQSRSSNHFGNLEIESYDAIRDMFYVTDFKGSRFPLNTSYLYSDYEEDPYINVFVKNSSALNFIPISMDVATLQVACQHSWKASSAEPGKTKWCSICDGRE